MEFRQHTSPLTILCDPSPRTPTQAFSEDNARFSVRTWRRFATLLRRFDGVRGRHDVYDVEMRG
jgi:hypothetical protein